MRKKGLIDVVFGDIGCYALLYFLNAVDTALCMGAGEAMRQGFVLSRPEEMSRCLAVVGDSTECHTGMAATRNAVYRNIAGVKVILDNSWTAMTGGQPSPTSPHNLAGEEIRFDLPKTIEAHGAKTHVIPALRPQGTYGRLSTPPWPMRRRASSPPSSSAKASVSGKATPARSE